MKVQVKQRHIDKGIPNHWTESPIVLAVVEQRGGAEVYETSDGFVTIMTGAFGTETADYRMPRSAREFSRRFDAGEDVSEITFNMIPLH